MQNYFITFDLIYCTVWNHIHTLFISPISIAHRDLSCICHPYFYHYTLYTDSFATVRRQLKIIPIKQRFSVHFMLVKAPISHSLSLQMCFTWQWASLRIPQPFNPSPLHPLMSASMCSVRTMESVWCMRGRLLAGKCFITALITLWI